MKQCNAFAERFIHKFETMLHSTAGIFDDVSLVQLIRLISNYVLSNLCMLLDFEEKNRIINKLWSNFKFRIEIVERVYLKTIIGVSFNY